MASNLGFDNGHPYLEIGADEGMFFQSDGRVLVTDVEPPPTVRVTLERSLDGSTWEPVVETSDITSAIDWEAWSYGDIQYRVTAFTAEGAASVQVTTVQTRSGALWLSGGIGYGITARLFDDPDVSMTAGRQRTTKQYAGRSKPVAYAGEAVSRVISVAGMVMDRSDETATVEQLRVMAQLEPDMFMFRDPDGRRVYGTISGIELARVEGFVDESGFNADWEYRFTFTETEPR